MADDFENIGIVPGESNSIAPQNLADANLVSDEELVLPPNTNGADVGNIIDAATLGSFNPQGASGAPQDDLEFVRGQANPLSGETLALGDATNELFMPGLNKSIRVGGTSGQLTGSRDIFAAQGGLVPFAALERRKAAEQKAVLDKEKRRNSFKRTDPKLAENKFFNDNIIARNNQHDEEFIARAKAEFGKDWQIALTSSSTKIGREYLTGKDNLNTMVDQADQVTGLLAEVDTAIEKGDQFVSDATLRLRNDANNLTGSFAQEGRIIGGTNLKDLISKLETSDSLDSFINDQNILKNIEGEILETAGIDDSRHDQFRTTTRFTKDFEAGARTQAKRVKSNAAFRNREDLSEEGIFEIIMNLKGKVDKRTATVKAKPKKAKGTVDPDSIQVSDQKKVINVAGQNFKVKQSVDLPNTIKTSPVQFDGLITVGTDGTLKNVEGIQNVRGVALDVITDANGVERKVYRAQIEHKEEDPSSGKEVSVWKDAVLDYDNVKAGLSNSSEGAKQFVDKFDEVSIKTPERKKQFGDLTKDFEGEFGEDVEDIGRRFASSNFKHDEFNKFLASESKAGRDIVLTEEAKEQFNTKLTEKTFNEAKKKVSGSGVKFSKPQETGIAAFMKANNLDRKEAIEILKKNKRL